MNEIPQELPSPTLEEESARALDSDDFEADPLDVDVVDED